MRNNWPRKKKKERQSHYRHLQSFNKANNIPKESKTFLLLVFIYIFFSSKFYYKFELYLIILLVDKDSLTVIIPTQVVEYSTFQL